MKINITFLAGILLAAISLFFSATGLVHLFAGAGVAIMVMAGAFELAKVTITVHLIRNFRWRIVPLALAGALVCLTAISSIGIYGYLGRAYNVGHKAATVGAGNVSALDEQVKALEADRDRLYAQIEAIPATQGTNRRRLTTALQPQLQTLDATIRQKRDSLAHGQTDLVGRATDVGELRYAAELLGVSQDSIAKLVITVLAFLLDPLAVLLVTASGAKSAANLAGDLQHRVDDKDLDEWYLENWRESKPGTCNRPAENGKPDWFCRADAGHEGPCPAVPYDPRNLPIGLEAKRQATFARVDAQRERDAIVKPDRVAALQESVKGRSPGLDAAMKSHRKKGSRIVANEKHRT